MSDTPCKPQPNPVAPWVDLCPLAELPNEGGKYIAAEGRHLAVFKTPGEEVRVLDDTCPHAGGSLATGWVDKGCAHCPWHGWAFRLDDGVMPDEPTMAVRAYPARVHEGKVQIQILN